jgi:hypothetical protein
MTQTIDINQEIQKVLTEKINGIVSNVDIGSIILERIDNYINERASSGKLSRGVISHEQVDWTDYVLPAAHIGTGVIKNFTSQGIDDHATEVNLTVLDGQVIIENETITKDLVVVESANIKQLTVDNLTINQKLVIKDPLFSAHIRGMIDNKIAQSQEDNTWDTMGKPLLSNGVEMLSTGKLGPSIVESNLRKVGRLTELSVTGEATLGETVYIGNGKMAINTDEPSGVFTVWDEEAELSIRKYKNRTMYVGSTRDSELVFGVGGDAIVNIRRTGVETNSVKIGNITISNGNKEPSEGGSPGDLVINDSVNSGQPWAWRCTGGKKWIPLK